MGSVPNVFTRFGSLNYPTREKVAKNEFGTNVRFNYAFSNPVVLSLVKGDVLFITKSFLHEGIMCPVIFDLSVCCLTQWLESKGVAVLFSAGGGKNVASRDLTAFSSRFAELYQLSTWPGIVVGGVDQAAQQIQSNYGATVCCYAAPLASKPDFDESSAATSVVAGLVIRAQAHAKKRGRFLTPAEVKRLLQSCKRQPSISPAGRISVPDWPSLETGINTLIP